MIAAFFLVVFILISSITVMNLLVGVLVDVIGVVSSVEKEELTVNWVKQTLKEIMSATGFDKDGDNLVSKEEFDALLMNPRAARMVQELDVDVVGLVDFSDYIFQEGAAPLTFGEFMEVVLSFRGTNNATVKDIVDLRKFVLLQLHEQKLAITQLVRAIQNQVREHFDELEKPTRPATSDGLRNVVHSVESWVVPEVPSARNSSQQLPHSSSSNKINHGGAVIPRGTRGPNKGVRSSTIRFGQGPGTLFRK